MLFVWCLKLKFILNYNNLLIFNYFFISLLKIKDNSQQYLPPSEQQAPEPKKYTGSAIPSRSFKILQAMTQPENAGKF